MLELIHLPLFLTDETKGKGNRCVLHILLYTWEEIEGFQSWKLRGIETKGLTQTCQQYYSDNKIILFHIMNTSPASGTYLLSLLLASRF